MGGYIQVLLIAALSWACVTTLEHDCYGDVSGLCRSPSTCSEEFSSFCPESGLCCPDSFETLEDNLLRGVPIRGCKNNKCLRYYRGWWSKTCGGRSRKVFYCKPAKVHCCTSACRRLPGCVSRRGYCVSNPTRCPGKVYNNLCKGVSCYCCVRDTKPPTMITTMIPKLPTTMIPQSTTTTTTPQSTATTTTPQSTTTTTTPQSTTTTTTPQSTTTTTTPQSTTTTTTPQSTTTTTSQSTTTTNTATSSCQTSSTSASTCSATGEPGVDCTCVSSCSEYGANHTGWLSICPISNCPPVRVLCVDGYTTIIFRSKDSDVSTCDFKRDWADYKKGFCFDYDAEEGEYWLGNENLYEMTNGRNHSMMMFGYNPADTMERKLYYSTFSVGDESTNYTLTVGGFDNITSSGVDLFVAPPTTNIILNGMSFSTKERDNDNKDGASCSEEQHDGGWWFNECTGLKPTQPNIDWYYWNGPTIYTQGRLDLFFIAIKENS